LKNIAILAFVTLASPALANGLPPHTQEEWFVNSGRYLNGQIVSYPAPSQKQIVAYAGSRHERLIERRTSATTGMWSIPQGFSGREQMVSATGSLSSIFKQISDVFGPRSRGPFSYETPPLIDNSLPHHYGVVPLGYCAK